MAAAARAAPDRRIPSATEHGHVRNIDIPIAAQEPRQHRGRRGLGQLRAALWPMRALALLLLLAALFAAHPAHPHAAQASFGGACGRFLSEEPPYELKASRKLLPCQGDLTMPKT